MMDLAELGGARALRAIVALEPVDGPGGRVFPMTALGDRGGQHVVEDGPDGRRVLVDSCASQANRQETALLEAREAGLIELADIVVDLSGTAVPRPSVCTLEMPHRIADAILRDSEIDGVPFARSTVGRAILGATFRDLTPILTTSPASLVFGTWFSQHGLGSFGLKIERASVGEIWGHGAQLGKTIGSRLDPSGWSTSRSTGPRTAAGRRTRPRRRWSKGKPVPGAKKKTSELNHSNVPPTILERGVDLRALRAALEPERRHHPPLRLRRPGGAGRGGAPLPPGARADRARAGARGRLRPALALLPARARAAHGRAHRPRRRDQRAPGRRRGRRGADAPGAGRARRRRLPRRRTS